MEAIKILVIEDVHYLRNDIMEMLRFEGFDVRGAENGLVGVAVAREFMPDLIVCDIMMPELNGYGVLEELRHHDETATVPFIFLTAKTDRFDMRHGMGLGADDYLTKPFLTTELLEAIKARLNRRKDYSKDADITIGRIRENITTALPHELRTPLNTIIGFSDMLMLEAKYLQPDQIVEWSQHINEAAMRLYRLVENYLTYVRIEAIARDPAKLQDLQDETIHDPCSAIQYQAMHRAQQAKRELDLQMEVSDKVKVAISEGDLTKITDELLDNAFKFSEKGSDVLLRAYETDGEYRLVVTDSGRGMKPEQIASIGAYMQFDRWFYEQQGAGLGLIIARRLAELHRGSLSITSAPDVGTTITVNLPLAAG
jgi:two-component system, sensor histidine kinase and response regulator